MKGQWFLISAVIAVGAFLSISIFFRDYFVFDTTYTIRINEETYFSSLKMQFDAVVAQSTCTNLDANLKEFEYFAQKKMAEIGYFLYLDHTINGCIATKKIVLASERAVLNEGIDYKDVLHR